MTRTQECGHTNFSSPLADHAETIVMNQAVFAPSSLKGPRTVQILVVLFALASITGLGLLIQHLISTRMALLFIIGAALGIVLYQSLFGFTSALRVMLADGRSAGFRAQMIMLGVACLLFFPALGAGSIWGHPVVGSVSPVGVSLAIGSFLFGVGMQLGGGCASGTLFSVGGGNTRLWGGMVMQRFGVPIETWHGYSAPAMQNALAGGVLSDVTSVMDFGIVIGAMLCAGLARKFKPEWRISGRHVVASVLGGFLLGYGARLAYGCNIGAFFSGIASGSVHGGVWIVFALIGNWAGIYLRPFFSLSVPNR